MPDRELFVHIRDYRTDDQPEVLALQTSADADLGATVPEDFYDDLQRIDAAYRDGAFLVAAIDGTIIGMGGLFATGEIVRMRVDSRHRRKGVASRILQALLERARDLNLNRVFLHTLREQHAAQRLYQAAGFLEVGRGEIHGNAVIAYERTL